MSDGSTNMRRSECPCAPPAGLSDVLLDTFYDDWAKEKRKSQVAAILRSFPDSSAAVFYHFMYLYELKIEADSLKEISFDEMVELARDHLFGMGVPSFETEFAKNHYPVDALAEIRFFLYQQGMCLDCQALIDNVNRPSERAWSAQRYLRTLLGLFDQRGEPIPKGLRGWSAQSRLKLPPKKDGRPRENWLRNFCIVRIVALLAYATGKPPTRNEESSHKESPSDAVVAAFEAEGFSLCIKTVKSAWSKNRKGTKLLERWRVNAK